MLPGHLLHRIAKRSCSTTTCERVIEPLIADLQREWLSADRPARRAIARIRGYASFWQTMLVCGLRATPRALTAWPLSKPVRVLVLLATSSHSCWESAGSGQDGSPGAKA